MLCAGRDEDIRDDTLRRLRPPVGAVFSEYIDRSLLRGSKRKSSHPFRRLLCQKNRKIGAADGCTGQCIRLFVAPTAAFSPLLAVYTKTTRRNQPSINSLLSRSFEHNLHTVAVASAANCTHLKIDFDLHVWWNNATAVR